MKHLSVFTCLPVYLFLMFTSFQVVFSQTSPPDLPSGTFPLDGTVDCTTPHATPYNPPPEALHHCFDVDIIQENCTKIWLRTNVHFFLDDNCEGSLDPGLSYINREQAYIKAEELVDAANAQLENNYWQWNQAEWAISEPEDTACVPFRYLLTGVYIHCNTAAQSTNGFNLNTQYQPNFGANVNSEFNVYLVDYIGSTTGQANGIPGNCFFTENFSVGNFNHEFGHVLNLWHSWIDDFIDDTPPISFKYDYNCDGDFTDNYAQGVGYEGTIRQCWIYFYMDNLPNPPPIDYDGDDVIDIPNPCVVEPPCIAFPCCDWKYINNNIMAYSSFQECCAAYTAGQVTSVLNNLSTDTYCEYIEEITDDCPPPAANMGIFPWEADEDDCAFCIQLAASKHDQYFMVEFYEDNGSGNTLVHTSGWLEGPASSYCIAKSIRNVNQYNNGFVAGHEYIAILSIENYCGDIATEELKFTLPNIGCQPDTPTDIGVFGLSPNPFTNNLTIDYELINGGNVHIWIVAVTDLSNPTLLHQNSTASSGVYQQTFSTATLNSGVYSVVLQVNDQLTSKVIVKN